MSTKSPVFRLPFVSHGHSLGIQYEEQTLTHQSFKDECDFNKVMAQWAKTGIITHVNERQPVYGDVDPVDFQTALNTVIQAEESFMALPAHVRDRFDNDPSRLFEFLADEKNFDAAADLGLLDPDKVAARRAPSSAGASSGSAGDAE